MRSSMERRKRGLISTPSWAVQPVIMDVSLGWVAVAENISKNGLMFFALVPILSKENRAHQITFEWNCAAQCPEKGHCGYPFCGDHRGAADSAITYSAVGVAASSTICDSPLSFWSRRAHANIQSSRCAPS
jgi:hypothetical protein